MFKTMQNNFIKWLIYFAIFFIFLMPLLQLCLMSLHGANGIGLENFQHLLQESRTREAIYNTILIAVCSTLLALLFGGIFAFLTAYTNLQNKRLIELMVLAPFIIPSYIIALSWSSLLDGKGMFTGIDIYSMSGIIFIMGLCHIPIVYLSVISSLRRIPQDLEWASRTSGYTPWQTFFKINLPLAMPAFIAGGILSFLASIDNFAIPAFLGISSNIPVLSTYIYEKVIGFGPSSFHLAAGLSVILSIIALSGTTLQNFFVKRSSNKESMREDFSIRIHFSPPLRRTVEWSCLTFLGILDIVPLLTMVESALQKNYSNEFTLANFLFLLRNPGVHQAIYNSMLLAFLTCLLCILIGTACAYAKVRYQNRAAMALESAASLMYAIPGIVIALAMIFHWGKIPYIYGSLSMLLLAYTTRYLILQIKNSTTAILSVHPSLEEAGKISGSSQITIWHSILLPLLKRPICAGSLLIFISALTELSLSSLLAAANTKTIGLLIFNFQQGGDYHLSAAMSLCIVFIILLVYTLVEYYNHPKS